MSDSRIVVYGAELNSAGNKTGLLRPLTINESGIAASSINDINGVAITPIGFTGIVLDGDTALPVIANKRGFATTTGATTVTTAGNAKWQNVANQTYMPIINGAQNDTVTFETYTHNWQHLFLAINITAQANTVTINIKAKYGIEAPNNAVYDTILTSAALGVGTSTLKVSPTMPAVANLVAQHFVPTVVQIEFVTSGAWTAASNLMWSV